MTETTQPHVTPKRHRTITLVIACLVVCAVAAVTCTLLFSRREPEAARSDTDVALGVEQAVIVRYAGPRLRARPYRPGASVNLRIANEQQKGELRIYDIRYVVSLPGTFDLTEYLTSADGGPIDDLPPFEVRGLTSLTKDIESRIQEIETVGVHIWHWYYESLAGLGVFWIAWLLGLIFIGRPRRPAPTPVAAPPPSTTEQIERLLTIVNKRELSTEEKARLESLLLVHWRDTLGLADRRMAASCRRIAANERLGPLYRNLQTWLHNPRGAASAADFVDSYTQNGS